MRTAQDAITETRIILQDTVEPYRYPTSDLVRYLNNGMYELKRIRPDVFLNYCNKDLPQFIDDPDDFEEELPFSTIFFQSMVLFITGYAEIRDDEYAVDSRAALLLGAFTTQLTVPADIRRTR